MPFTAVIRETGLISFGNLRRNVRSYSAQPGRNLDVRHNRFLSVTLAETLLRQNPFYGCARNLRNLRNFARLHLLNLAHASSHVMHHHHATTCNHRYGAVCQAVHAFPLLALQSR